MLEGHIIVLAISNKFKRTCLSIIINKSYYNDVSNHNIMSQSMVIIGIGLRPLIHLSPLLCIQYEIFYAKNNVTDKSLVSLSLH